MSKKISQNGLSLIREFEGCKLEAYRCASNIWTIGIGTTKNVKPGMKITLAQAEEMLHRDLEEFEVAIAKYVKVALNQNQFDALACWVYNCGVGALVNSTLLKKLNAGDYKGAGAEFKRWNKGGGKVLTGLTKRRAEEAKLFLS